MTTTDTAQPKYNLHGLKTNYLPKLEVVTGDKGKATEILLDAWQKASAENTASMARIGAAAATLGGVLVGLNLLGGSAGHILVGAVGAAFFIWSSGSALDANLQLGKKLGEGVLLDAKGNKKAYINAESAILTYLDEAARPAAGAANGNAQAPAAKAG